MNAIVSVTRDWGIGRAGALIVSNRADMRRFVELTAGGTVIMGRKTYESLPHGALSRRRNIVLTRAEGFAAPGVEVAHTLGEVERMVREEDPDRVWLIGGAEVYRALIGLCRRAFVTRHDVVVDADSFFPDLEAEDLWVVESRGGAGVTEEGIPYEFVTYANLRLTD